MNYFTKMSIVYFFINNVNANSLVKLNYCRRGLQLFMKKNSFIIMAYCVILKIFVLRIYIVNLASVNF